MPYTDPIVFSAILASLILSIGYQWRRGLRWRPLAVTTFAMWFSFGVISTMVMHCLDVLWGLTHHVTSMTGKPFTYDWRTYSLLLFGALMIWFGVRCLRAALRIGRGEESARLEFLRLVAVVLAIVLPLIPVHPFFGLSRRCGARSACSWWDSVVVAGRRTRAPPIHRRLPRPRPVPMLCRSVRRVSNRIATVPFGPSLPE